MFVYTEVEPKLQVDLFTEGCQDYLRVVQKYEDSDTETIPLPLSTWTPSSCLLVRKYQQFAERIRDFVVYPDDIWIVTYPKCGTTWAQEMVWLLANDLDYATAKAVDVNKRSPYLEISTIGTNLNFDSLQVAAQPSKFGGPRIIKSHLPLNLLPKGLFARNHAPKLIYVTRNAKDTAVSYFHHYRMLLGYRGTVDTFLEAFLAGDLIYGAHSRHIDEFLRLQATTTTNDNVLVLRFEDMKRTMRAVLKRTAEFLRRDIGGAELDALAHHLSFEQMRRNAACNNEAMARAAMDMNGRAGEQFRFLRKGRVGTYAEEMPAEFIEKFDAAASLERPELKAYLVAEVITEQESGEDDRHVST